MFIPKNEEVRFMDDNGIVDDTKKNHNKSKDYSEILHTSMLNNCKKIVCEECL